MGRMTIEEFIAARVAEDEAYAEESGGGEWGSSGDSVNTEQETIYTLHHADHVARHDPARALRQCAFARGVLTSWRAVVAARNSREGHATNAFTEGQDAAAMMWLGDVLQQMAAIWSDHPDYQESWKP